MNKLIYLFIFMASITGCKATSQPTLVPALLTNSNANTLSVLQTTMKESLGISTKLLAADVFTTSSWLTLERAHNLVLGVVTEMPLKLRLMTDNQQNCYLSMPNENKTVSVADLTCQAESNSNQP